MFYSSNSTYTGLNNCGDNTPALFMLYNDLLTNIHADMEPSATGNTATALPPHVQQWISDASPSAHAT
jgi:hypothetical protein